MAVESPAAGEATRVRRTPVTRSTRVAALSLLAVGLGMVVIVAREGSLSWRAARLIVISGIAALLFTALKDLSNCRRAGLIFSAGITAMSIGVGIGIPHLAKGGWSVAAAAGLLTLAGGLVLASSGAAALVRGTRRRLRLLTIPALATTTVVVLYSVGQAVALTNVPPTALGRMTPADRGMEYRDVLFPSSNGVMLSGWYIPSDNGAAVVLLHGSGSTRSNVLDQAVVLARHGYGVLLFDARGHGRSHGRAMDAGWWGDQDTAGAVSFLETQPDVDRRRIGAVGMSMGGEEALGAAAADERIRAVVAEGAEQRVAADKRWLSDEFGVRGWLQQRVDWVTYTVADLLTSAGPPISLRDAVRAMAPRPVLLIAAGEVADEGLKGRDIQRGSPATVALWIVRGSGHTAGLDTAPDEWEQRVVGFLDRGLASNEADNR